MQPVSALLDLRLQRARDLHQGRIAGSDGERDPCDRWSLRALRGRLVELVGGADSANVTAAGRLILQAQAAGDYTAWVATHRDVFFPPDLAAAGVDLDCLPVVWALPVQQHAVDAGPRGARPLPSQSQSQPRAPEPVASPGAYPAGESASASARPAARAAERLLRSGAFGLVILDLARDLDLDVVSQGRLLRLAESHDALVLILRRLRANDCYSGSLIGVRARSSSERVGPGRFRLTITNTKDKREGPGWTTSEELDGPPGLY